MESVFLAGDWHGNRDWARASFAAARAEGCPVILQLGDFGLWPGRQDEWLDHVAQQAADTGVSMVWIDGNHEDHDALDRWREEADDRGLVRMRPGVEWATRGARWAWDDIRFGALGGAVSIDRFLRQRGVNWWPQEVVTQEDVDRLGDDPLDVLVTHAAPASTVFPPFRRLPLPPPIIDDVLRVRDLLEEAVRRTDPALVVHGHHHLRNRTASGRRVIEGLAHDKAGAGAWAVLRLHPEPVVEEVAA